MKYLINLLPEKEQNAADRIVYFSFHYLRYILVITQFVAICVFFYRFKVDQQIVDLRDVLKQKRAIVEATKPLLTEVERLDYKITNVREILTRQNANRAMYDYTFAALPQSITIKRIVIKTDALDIEGLSQDISVVQQLYKNFQSEKHFGHIQISNIEKSPDGFLFKLALAKYR